MEIFVIKNISFVLMIMVLTNCTFNTTEITNDLVTGIDGLTVPQSRAFTANEITIAKRICTNAKKKRDFFETLYNMTEKFRFGLEYKSCSATNVSTLGNFEATITNSNATYMEYSANQDNYFKEIITDQSNTMKPICDAVLFNTGEVQNTLNYSNHKLIYSFTIDNRYDRIEISKLVKNTDGYFSLAGIDAINFITLTTQASAKFLGVEKMHQRKINCDGKTFSSLTQTWIEATTNF